MTFKGKTADIETINALRNEIEAIKTGNGNGSEKIESLRESLRKNFNEIQTAIRTNKPFEVKVKMNRLL